MGNQTLAKPAAQVFGLLSFDKIGDHRHIVALFKGNTRGGQIDIHFVFLFLREQGKVLAHAFLLINRGKSNGFGPWDQGDWIAPQVSTPADRRRILLPHLRRSAAVKREDVMMKTASRRVVALLLAGATLGFSQLALAHAHLKAPVPADNAVVERAPQQLTLTFTEDIEPAFSGVEMINAQQQPVALEKAQLNPQQHDQLIVPIAQPLASGQYQVNWHVLSVDGHKTKGSYSFSVK